VQWSKLTLKVTIHAMITFYIGWQWHVLLFPGSCLCSMFPYSGYPFSICRYQLSFSRFNLAKSQEISHRRIFSRRHTIYYIHFIHYAVNVTAQIQWSRLGIVIVRMVPTIKPEYHIFYKCRHFHFIYNVQTSQA
jgi:hypothetical protein